MPTYEYVCESCEHEFEEFQSMSAKPLKKCPSCAKPKLRRKIGTGAAIIFKGSGFYETDYRSEGYKKAEKAEKESASPKPASDSGSGKSEAGKSDSSAPASGSDAPAKPAAAKPEPKPAAKGESKPKSPAKSGT